MKVNAYKYIYTYISKEYYSRVRSIVRYPIAKKTVIVHTVFKSFYYLLKLLQLIFGIFNHNILQ